MGGIQPLLERLKARKLFQWLTAYLAAAWLVLQALGALASAFHWPDAVQQGGIALLGVGLLVAVVVAWYHGEKGAQRVSGMEILMLAGILVIAAGVLRFVSLGPRSGGDGTGSAGAATPAPRVVEQGSIAVLPFLDLSPGRDQAYFSDGLSEELLDGLARLPELRVAARTSSFSFKGHDVPVDSIGRVLRVANVLEGSVRRDADRVRITVQLIDARTGYHRWSETYDRTLKDVFAVQDEISRAIVDALQLRLAGTRAAAPLVKEQTADPEAHALLLKGMFLARQGPREAVEAGVGLLRQAIARDPSYARAHAELAMAYAVQAYFRYGPASLLQERAQPEAARALALDPDLAEAHFAVARVAFLQWDFALAEAEFARALALNPGNASALSQHAWLLMDLGRTKEALAEAERAARLDPVVWPQQNNLAALYSYARQPLRAVQVFEGALPLSPDNPVLLSNLALTYSDLARHGDAIRTIERARVRAPDDQAAVAVAAYVYGRAGRRADAEQAIRSLLALPDLSPYFLASAYAGIGDRERVLSLLERAVAEKDASAPDLGVDPVFDGYRNEPRLQALVARMGLR